MVRLNPIFAQSCSEHTPVKPLFATLLPFTLILIAVPLSAETWFVRSDGGTRYTAKNRTGQCDGKADRAYRGRGVNQHCAFNDVRYLWMDGTYGNSAWVIAGGDTVVIRGCAALPDQQNSDAPHCRIGWDKATGNDRQNLWCAGVNAFWGCSMPPPPSGTATRPTRILGACAYGTYNCNPVNKFPYTSNNLTQLFGGFGLGAVINLSGSQHIDIEGLEITEHNGKCTRYGQPPYPRSCNTYPPAADDYANAGILTSKGTSDLKLQDVYIHGFTADGLAGPIGGPISMNRVFVGFNGFAGWNFDDGKPTPDAPGASITASYVTMVGNGCNEEYPIVHKQFPALSCYDSSSGGFGDSWSGQDTKLESFSCDHCVMAYNTKDGFIGPHTVIKHLTITNSESFGNMGQQWKWGTSPNSNTVFVNNVTIGNCRRMSQPISGAPPGYNRYLSDFCRAAGDVFSFYSAGNSTVLIADSTIIGYSATMFDFSCQTPNGCGSAHYVFRNNIVLGFLNPKSNPAEVPGLFYFSDPSVKLEPDHDVFFNLRSRPCPWFGRSDLICENPIFVGEPPLSLSKESELDNFNFHLTPGSEAIAHGLAIHGITTDFFGKPRGDSPTIGAVEPQ